MTDAQITPERVDELLRFLPQLDPAGSDAAPDVQISERQGAGGVLSLDAGYPPEVVEFFRLAAQPWWRDGGYAGKPAAEMIRDDASIAAASLDEIKALLTFCVRGERFCDGLWGEMIREGRIAEILRRLGQLRQGD